MARTNTRGKKHIFWVGAKRETRPLSATVITRHTRFLRRTPHCGTPCDVLHRRRLLASDSISLRAGSEGTYVSRRRSSALGVLNGGVASGVRNASRFFVDAVSPGVAGDPAVQKRRAADAVWRRVRRRRKPRRRARRARVKVASSLPVSRRFRVQKHAIERALGPFESARFYAVRASGENQIFTFYFLHFSKFCVLRGLYFAFVFLARRARHTTAPMPPFGSARDT